jgi:hypothetical protein
MRSRRILSSRVNVTRLRRDAHDKAPGCWLHADAFCLSA